MRTTGRREAMLVGCDSSALLEPEVREDTKRARPYPSADVPRASADRRVGRRNDQRVGSAVSAAARSASHPANWSYGSTTSRLRHALGITATSYHDDERRRAPWRRHALLARATSFPGPRGDHRFRDEIAEPDRRRRCAALNPRRRLEYLVRPLELRNVWGSSSTVAFKTGFHRPSRSRSPSLPGTSGSTSRLRSRCWPRPGGCSSCLTRDVQCPGRTWPGAR